MKIFDLIKKVLKEEKLPEGKNGILLLDIDDTLLKSDSSLLKIYRKLPTDKEEVALTTDEYAKEHVSQDNKKYYDYRDFRDPKKVYMSIVKGAPLINNLKVVDDFYNGGYKLGILTARGCADAVKKAIKAFLKVRDKNGNLIKAPISESDIHCVNDDKSNYPGDTDYEKKQNVLRDYAKKYDYVYFIDDDAKNLAAVKALKKIDPEIAYKLRSVNAKKNIDNAPIKEDVLIEMAVKDVTSEIVNATNDGDYKKALILYFNKIKDQDAYKGKQDTKSAVKHMISFGVTRTFSALEKKGTVVDGSAQALKNYGLKHIDEIADSVEYVGDPNYVAPKRTSSVTRYKIWAKTEDELKELIEKKKGEGYSFKDETPKPKNDKTKGDYFYVYGTKQKELSESVIEEMAVKDVSMDIRKNIQNENYKDALVEYLKAIKNQPTYAKLSVGDAYDKMRSYGLSRTFGAIEKDGRLPAGSTSKLKEFASSGKNREEIIKELSGLDTVSATNNSEEEKPAKKAKSAKKDVAVYSDTDSDTIKKIKDRIKKYSDLAKELEDYAYTGKTIKPFIVDLKANGENGVKVASKPKLSALDLNNPYLTKTERYIVPMKEFRDKFIPKFIEKKAMSEVDFTTKKDLDKAESLGAEYFEATKNKYLALYMAKLLKNIVSAFYEFTGENSGANLTDKEFLDKFSADNEFLHNDFVRLEKWFKRNNIKLDQAKLDSNKSNKVKKAASIPEEVNKVRKEYILYLNSLEKAIAEDKVGEFITDNNNYAIAYAILNPASNAEINAKDMKEFTSKANLAPNDKLSPTLKELYKERFDENKEPDFEKDYASVRSFLNRIRSERIKAVKEGGDLDKIDRTIEKLSKALVNATMDRLIAVDLVVNAANSAILNNFEEAAKRHEQIKKNYLEAHPEKKDEESVDPNSDKYKKYYTPEIKEKPADTSDAMFKAINKSLSKYSREDLIDKGIYIQKFFNIDQKRYSDDEIKELYNTFVNGGEEKLIELLKTDKFKTRRKLNYV